MTSKVCVIGDGNGLLDEGTRIIFESIRTNAPSDVSCLSLPSSATSGIAFLRRIRKLGPERIVYLTGPSTQSLILLGLLSRALGGKIPRIILGAHPMVSWGSWVAKVFRPEYFLALSGTSLTAAESHQIPSSLFFLGVDRSKFSPIPVEERVSVRKQLGLPVDAFIVLHVGHWKKNRNIALLGKLAREGFHVVFVASPRSHPSRQLFRELQVAGVETIHRYVQDIDLYYKAADMYISPVRDPAGIIEQPLSILEALATGLPVVAFPVGGVPDLAKEFGGITLVNRDDELLSSLDEASIVSPRSCNDAPPDWQTVTRMMLAKAVNTGARG